LKNSDERRDTFCYDADEVDRQRRQKPDLSVTPVKRFDLVSEHNTGDSQAVRQRNFEGISPFHFSSTGKQLQGR